MTVETTEVAAPPQRESETAAPNPAEAAGVQSPAPGSAQGVYQQAPGLGELSRQLLSRFPKGGTRISECPACGGGRTAAFTKIRGFGYDRCRDCGYTFLNPPPADELLSAFYKSPFYANYRELERRRIETETEKARREKPDARGYFSASMYTGMDRLAGWLGDDKSHSILDFGCGPGAFIAYLRDEHGFTNVEGLEINPEGIALARGVYGLHAVSSPKELSREKFDCVLLFEVIEHVPRPDVFLDMVIALVKPGGSLFITTPAVDNFLGHLFPKSCYHYTAPSHVSLFTLEAMKRLMARKGCKIERVETDTAPFGIDRVLSRMVYSLDFVSPRGDRDDHDIRYVPNLFGRMLGLKTRNAGPMKFLTKGWGPLNRLGPRIIRKKRVIGENDHLYVLARLGA